MSTAVHRPIRAGSTRMSNLGREMADLVAAIRRTPGWRVDDGAHYKAFSPDGVTMIAISKTPGSPRRVKAYKSQLTKLGVDFTQGRKKA